MVMNRGMIGNEEREIRECKAMDVFESQTAFAADRSAMEG